MADNALDKLDPSGVQMIEARRHLLVFIADRLKNPADIETIWAMLSASLQAAHSEGLRDGEDLLRRMADGTENRPIPMQYAANRLRDLRTLNDRTVEPPHG